VDLITSIGELHFERRFLITMFTCAIFKTLVIIGYVARGIYNVSEMEQWRGVIGCYVITM